MTTDVTGPDLARSPGARAPAEMAHQDVPLLLRSDEVSRRDSASGVMRAARCAHELGHIAAAEAPPCALRADRMLETLRHARLDNSHEAALRKLIAVDLLILDAFGLDAMIPPRATTPTRS